jgi:hypothetical protein
MAWFWQDLNWDGMYNRYLSDWEEISWLMRILHCLWIRAWLGICSRCLLFVCMSFSLFRIFTWISESIAHFSTLLTLIYWSSLLRLYKYKQYTMTFTLSCNSHQNHWVKFCHQFIFYYGCTREEDILPIS